MMGHYWISRTASALWVILSLCVVVFLLIHVVPGDPVDVIFGESASITDKQVYREALGLDKPLLQQLSSYLYRLSQFDLGNSIHTGRPVITTLAETISATLTLSFSALLIAMLIAFPLGILSAVHKGRRWDHVATMLSLSGIAIPNFLLGPLLVLFFSIGLGLFPVSGFESVSHLVLPSLTLGLSMAAILTRMIRSSLLEVMGEDYIRTANAKGIGPARILWFHAMANGMLPILTVIGALAGSLLSGAVVTEIVFDWPGIGSLLIESIHKRDYPLIQACVLSITIFYILINTITDILYNIVDPRSGAGR